MQNLLDYYDWMRTRLGIPTTLSLGLPGAKAGDESPIAENPNNWTLKNFITNACSIVNQHVGLSGDATLRTFPVAAQTADGPYSFDIGSLPGYRQRSVISIRRAYWNDGSSVRRLEPAILSDLDNRWIPYMGYSVGTPIQFALEGSTVFLIPGPSAAGSFQFMATTGALAPQADTDSFEGIPESYDPCILYIALVDYGKSMSADAEMSARAQAYTPDAAAGLDRLAAWFNGSNEEAKAGMFADVRYMRRNQWAYRR